MFANFFRRSRVDAADGPHGGQARESRRNTRGLGSRRGEPKHDDRRAVLAQRLMQALADGRHDEAIDTIHSLVELEPDEARWHQKHGEVLRRIGRDIDAAAAYRRAARRYDDAGFAARASAALRVAEALDPAAVAGKRREPLLSERVLRRERSRAD